MALDLTEVNEIIDDLRRALGTGAAEITYQGRRVVYRGEAEIVKGINYFVTLRNGLDGSTPRAKQIKMNSSKGL